MSIVIFLTMHFRWYKPKQAKLNWRANPSGSCYPRRKEQRKLRNLKLEMKNEGQGGRKKSSVEAKGASQLRVAQHTASGVQWARCSEVCTHPAGAWLPSWTTLYYGVRMPAGCVFSLLCLVTVKTILPAYFFWMHTKVVRTTNSSLLLVLVPGCSPLLW